MSIPSTFPSIEKTSQMPLKIQVEGGGGTGVVEAVVVVVQVW